MRTSLGRLKWVGIFAPVAFLGGGALVFHLVFPSILDSVEGLIATLVTLAVAASVFSQVMFSLVERLEQRIIDQNRELAALGTVAETLSRPLELQTALQVSLDMTIDALDAQAGVICILDRENRELFSAAHKGLSPEIVERVRRQKVAKGSLEAEVLDSGRPVIVNNAFEDPRIAELCRREGYHSTISVPLKSQGTVVGVLGLVSRRESAFDDSIAHLLQSIGDHVGISIEKAMLFRELEERNRDLATLNEVSEALTSTLELGEVMEIAVRSALDSSDARAAELWLVDDAGSVTSGPTARRGESIEVVAAAAQSISEGRRCRAVSSQQAVFPADGTPCAACRQDGADEESGLHVATCLPLKSGAKLVGVLRLRSEGGNPMPVRRRQVVHAVASQIGVAITNAQLYEQIQDLSILEERDRIAREMHDGMAQVLGYVNAKAFAVRKLLAEGHISEAEEYLSQLEEAARDVYADVREGVLALRTTAVGDGGLIDTISDYLEKYTRQSGVQVRYQATGSVADVSLPASVDLQVMRIIQEALSNVRKHSRAKDVEVTLASENGHLAILVADKGRGFDVSGAARGEWPRFGLQTMRERAESIRATFEVESEPGEGTTVRVTIPLAEVQQASRR